MLQALAKALGGGGDGLDVRAVLPGVSRQLHELCEVPMVEGHYQEEGGPEGWAAAGLQGGAAEPPGKEGRKKRKKRLQREQQQREQQQREQQQREQREGPPAKRRKPNGGEHVPLPTSLLHVLGGFAGCPASGQPALPGEARGDGDGAGPGLQQAEEAPATAALPEYGADALFDSQLETALLCMVHCMQQLQPGCSQQQVLQQARLLILPWLPAAAAPLGWAGNLGAVLAKEVLQYAEAHVAELLHELQQQGLAAAKDHPWALLGRRYSPAPPAPTPRTSGKKPRWRQLRKCSAADSELPTPAHLQQALQEALQQLPRGEPPSLDTLHRLAQLLAGSALQQLAALPGVPVLDLGVCCMMLDGRLPELASEANAHAAVRRLLRAGLLQLLAPDGCLVATCPLLDQAPKPQVQQEDLAAAEVMLGKLYDLVGGPKGQQQEQEQAGEEEEEQQQAEQEQHIELGAACRLVPWQRRPAPLDALAAFEHLAGLVGSGGAGDAAGEDEEGQQQREEQEQQEELEELEELEEDGPPDEPGVSYHSLHAAAKSIKSNRKLLRSLQRAELAQQQQLGPGSAPPASAEGRQAADRTLGQLHQGDDLGQRSRAHVAEVQAAVAAILEREERLGLQGEPTSPWGLCLALPFDRLCCPMGASMQAAASPPCALDHVPGQRAHCARPDTVPPDRLSAAGQLSSLVQQHREQLAAVEQRAAAALAGSRQRHPPPPPEQQQQQQPRSTTKGGRPLYRPPPAAAGAAAAGSAGPSSGDAASPGGGGGFGALHQEVVRFAAACAPTQVEVAEVGRLMAQVDATVRAIWPHGRSLLFGSQVGVPPAFRLPAATATSYTLQRSPLTP
jgi:hypothetical protein